MGQEVVGTVTSAESGLERAHAAMLAEGRIQTSLPAHSPPETPAWLRWLADAMAPLVPYFPTIFWTLAGLGAAFTLLMIADAIWPGRIGLMRWLRRRRADAPAASALPPPDAERARALIAEADALAGAGHFGEATRLVLGRSIAEMNGRLPGSVRPDRTGRELAASALLPPAPASQLQRMVAIVERNLFAAQPLGAADWQACRGAYIAFVQPEAWTTAPVGAAA